MSLTLRGLIDQFVACISHCNAPGTVAYYKRHLERFFLHVGDAAIDSLKPLELITWGHSWHQIQAVQRLFNWAANDAELIARNPFRKVKKPRRGQRKRTLKPNELARMLRGSEAHFRAYLLALRETVGRPQEIRSLRWSELEAGDSNESIRENLLQGRAVFRLITYKGQARRTDPDAPRILLVSPRLGRLLARLLDRALSASEFIFHNSQGKPWTTNALRLRMRRLRKRLGLGADARGERVVCYTIRHTQATAAAVRGVRDRVLAELMGHTSTRTTARYQHIELDHLQAAMERLHEKKKRVLPQTGDAGSAGEVHVGDH
jgi:integrase